MKKKIQALSLAAALMLTVPIGVYAANANGTSKDTSSTAQSEDGAIKEGKFAGKEKGGHHERRNGKGVFVSDEVLELLQLDKETLIGKLKEGVPLSTLADQQGVSRDALKAAVIGALERQQAERKSAFE
ncbi:hypothetical protein [Paenibacillus sp. 598K]|uniref:hypothetical protein n=1 Tax=Paenibacillus sp. 598K TaxID=1117987 RepID=UPI000FFF275B|nr:hypothetical protein [Paenibacillus sp. 598K]